MTPAPDHNPPPPALETRFAILLFSDIVGSTDLKGRHGVPAYRAALQVHNDHFERVVRECRGLRILQNMGDGYFAEAGSVAEAVKFALLFQDAMRAGPWGEIQLTTRVGIHAGEVTALLAEGGSGIVAPAADLAARVMSLAVGGQILLTRFPFDEARHFLREHPAVAGHATPPLRWLAHGPYLLKGRDEPMDIFEVGAEGFAPLTPPPDGEKAKRAIRPGEEETLGWRPAIGLEIPGRPGWKLIGQLGAGGFGEVWTGEHAKLRQRRAFKFCFDDERLRALKREVTLVRLLRTALGDRDDIVRFHELKLDEPPFYLESDLAPHGNLLQWAERQGGLAAIPLAQRIALVAHTATALAAAHSIGVLHKDIKPTNILIFDAPDGTARPRLVDFGIGTLADPAVLGQHGVTAAGFTRATIAHSTGTPTYSPPEYLAGKPYTVQGDIYGLGVLLYQLLTADSTRPLAPGWERDIPDPLLREDIAACVDGDPARRLASAADLAERLFKLEQRRAEIAEKERLTREAAARAESEANAVANRLRVTRLRKLAGAFAVLALLAIAGGVLAWVNQRKANAALRAEAASRREMETQRDHALQAEQQARAIQQFLLARVIQVARPAREAGGLGHDVTVRQALDAAEPAIGRSFGGQPVVELAIRQALGDSYLLLGEPTKAVKQLERVQVLYARVPETDPNLLLAALTRLATAYQGANLVADYVQATEAAWQQATNVFGTSAHTSLGLQGALGVAYRDAKRYSDAIRTFSQALQLAEKTFGSEDLETLNLLNGLSFTYYLMGEHAAAIPLMERILQIRERTLGPDDNETTRVMVDLARTYQSAGRWTNAQPLFQTAHAARSRVNGADSGLTLIALEAYAAALDKAGLLDEAETRWRESKRLRENKFGVAHPDTLRAVRSLTHCQMQAGHVSEAARTFQEVYEGVRAKHGFGHVETLRLLADLIDTLNRLGRADEIRRLLDEAALSLAKSDLPNASVLADIFPPAENPPPPGWYPDFLRYMAQMRLNPDGELETLKAADWLALRERLRAVLRASANADTPYLRILRKYVREN